MEAGHGAVDGARHLRVRAREVADELVVRDRHLHADQERAVADPVVVDHVLSLEDALRQPGEREPRRPLAVVEERVHRAEHHVGSVLVAELLEAQLAEP